MFLSIDGGDGVGKSTQLALLKKYLENQGRSVVVCRDPGSSPLGESIREILLRARSSMSISDRSELFLFMAARAQLIEEVIRPALAEGKIVLVDRFLLSTVVYQGYAAGLSPESIWKIGQFAVGSCFPDITFLLDLDPDQAMNRIQRPLDRMELKGSEYHKRVRDGFRSAIKEIPLYFSAKGYLIDAGLPPEEITKKMIEFLPAL
ncbi:MAG: dTMP kinase [Planctomycetia bacterium]|nr:dTMP kinase [Planctomycetia bacterium]